MLYKVERTGHLRGGERERRERERKRERHAVSKGQITSN